MNISANLEDAAPSDPFAATFEQAAVGLAHLAPDGSWLRVNPRFCEIVGYSREELLGLSFQRITHPDDLARDLAQLQRLQRGEIDHYTQEKRYLRKDGEEQWVKLSIALVRKPDRSPDYFISVVEDISRRKAAESNFVALYTAMDEGVALHELVFDAAGNPVDYRILSVNPAYSKILGLTAEQAEGQMASAVYGQTPPPFLDTYSEVALRGQGTRLDVDFARLERTFTISVFSPGPNRFATVFTDITEQKRLEQERQLSLAQLGKERAFLKTLIQTLPDLVWLKDPRGVYLACNPRFEQFFGAREADIVGKSDYDFVDGELADFFRDHDLKAMAKGGPSVNEEWLTFASDGHRAFMETTKTPMVGADGQVIGVLGIAHDITEREAANARIGRLTRLLDQSPDDIFVIQAETARVLDVNATACEHLGYSREELLQLHLWDFSVRVTNLADWEQTRDRVAASQGQTFEARHRHRDGHLIPVEISANRIEEKDDTVFIAIARDISDRLATDAALRDSSERFQAALASTKDGFWLVNTQGRILEVNDAYCRYSGYTREALLQQRVIDIDAGETESSVQARIQQIQQDGGAIFETVHRRRDGTTWPVEVSLSYSPLQGGLMFTFLRDISERKINERLGLLRQQLAEMVYNAEPQRLLQAALDTAEAMTLSKIGFFHFVEADQETVSLQTWSTRTLTEMCYAKGDGLHYPVSAAGVWVDCILQRQPVIHNDYASLPHRKGLPDGHAPLVRELTVPLFRDNRIVGVIGMGNKASDYVAEDVEIVTRIGDMTFDYIERQQAEQKIQFMAYNDVLTGLPNRQLLADRLHQAISLARRSDQLLAICYLDLDGFKPVNDRYGHEAGDQLLVQLADRLQEELREGDTLARLGGDEFVILLGGLRNIYHGEEIVQRILSTIASPFDIAMHRVHVSASIGVTVFPQDDVDPDTLLRHADQAMYKAKENGKNTYSLFDPIEDQKLHSHREAIEAFELALHGDELLLYFQPRIDLRTGALASVEALVRWQHPEEGLLPPARFLPTIDDTPLEIALDEWVLETALDQHMRWREQGLRVEVSVNLSPRHIQQSGFPTFLAGLLARYPDDIAGFLELEVLETSTIDDTSRVAQIMTACAELGVRFSLDDFGTGYSSLTYFHRLPIGIVKIDQHFVRDMLSDPRDQDIVEGVLRLADALKRPVVAEGVENIELGLMLAQLGCEFAQGYGIAQPMPADRLPGWASAWEKDNIWHALAAETLDQGTHYDLNVSLFTHRNWINQLQRCLDDGQDCPEMDAATCQFSRWYHGIGTARYGTRPQYPFIQAKHTAVHRLAQELLELSRSGEGEKARARRAELQKLSEELFELLRKLADPH